jgi:hypothetical protein
VSPAPQACFHSVFVVGHAKQARVTVYRHVGLTMRNVLTFLVPREDLARTMAELRRTYQPKTETAMDENGHGLPEVDGA